jgi:hypothetical protein
VGEDGGLIAGHARVLAARQLGVAEIPVMVAAGWTEAQKRAYVLADNQLAITGSGWDPELLRLELGELKLGGFDLSLTGFFAWVKPKRPVPPQVIFEIGGRLAPDGGELETLDERSSARQSARPCLRGSGWPPP